MKIPIFKGFHKSTIYKDGTKIDASRWVISNNISFSPEECLIFDDDGSLNSPDHSNVEMDSIGHYIEKDDKHNNRIFSGDILHDGFNVYWLVLPFEHGSFSILGLNGGRKGTHFDIAAVSKNWEIVGNEYDTDIAIKEKVILVSKKHSNP